MTSEITCSKGCCTLKVMDYMVDKKSFSYSNTNVKAGVFIYDPSTDSVLIVQSKGNHWGSPKGTMIPSDISATRCAIREVKEETGLDLTETDFKRMTFVRPNVSYFYTEIPKCEVFVQDHVENNDANGIGWIKTSCLEECVNSGLLDFNHHFYIIYRKFLDKKLERKSQL